MNRYIFNLIKNNLQNWESAKNTDDVYCLTYSSIAVKRCLGYLR